MSIYKTMTFGQTLQKIRREKKLTQRGIAQTIEMDFSYFSKLENDRFDSKPTRETIEKIADALGCTPAERTELLAAAGRIDQDLEKIIVAAQTRPEMNKLFRAAINLPREEIEDIINNLKKDQKS